MPSAAIAGKAHTPARNPVNSNANKAGFTQPVAKLGGGNALRAAVTKPTAHSYKAADFTVSMNMDDANKMQAQDRNNFSAIGQRGYNNSFKQTVPKIDMTTAADVTQQETVAVNNMRLNEQYKINSSFMGAEQESLLNTT